MTRKQKLIQGLRRQYDKLETKQESLVEGEAEWKKIQNRKIDILEEIDTLLSLRPN